MDLSHPRMPSDVGPAEEPLQTQEDYSQLRILVATEYLPPFVSGIANRCRDLISGYRAAGAQVTVVSVAGTRCDMTGTSIANPFYSHQR
jgi:hypothetical protein